jgi:hypothetical protein
VHPERETWSSPCWLFQVIPGWWFGGGRRDAAEDDAPACTLACVRNRPPARHFKAAVDAWACMLAARTAARVHFRVLRDSDPGAQRLGFGCTETPAARGCARIPPPPACCHWVVSLPLGVGLGPHHDCPTVCGRYVGYLHLGVTVRPTRACSSSTSTSRGEHGYEPCLGAFARCTSGRLVGPESACASDYGSASGVHKKHISATKTV